MRTHQAKRSDIIKYMKRVPELLLCVLLLLVPLTARAQSYFEDFPGATELLEGLLSGDEGLTSTLLEDVISTQNPRALVYSPENPEPGERVTVSIQDYGRPSISSNISWFVDGELFSSGVGATSISFPVKEVGLTTEVYAQIVSSLGTIETTAPIVIGASYVDMLWEAIDADVPPFYKGKALPSWDTIVRLYAVPEIYNASGQQIPASTLVYTWDKNGRPNDLNPQSGYGKSSVFALADFARKQHLFGVSLLHSNTGITSRNRVAIKLQDPEILFYEKHPLGGIIFERALPETIERPATGGGTRVVAYPFGLDNRNKDNISFIWRLNNRIINNTNEMKRGEIPLVSNGSKGVSNVSVEIKSGTKALQSAEKTLRVNIE